MKLTVLVVNQGCTKAPDPTKPPFSPRANEITNASAILSLVSFLDANDTSLPGLGGTSES